MKFTTDKNTLLVSLNGATDITRTIPDSDTNRYILRNIKLETKGANLYITGTDADIVVKNNVFVDVEREGNVLILGQLFFDVISKLDDGAEIICDYAEKEEIMYVYSGKSKFKLSTLPADNFPNFEEQELANHFTVDASDLLKILDKTKFAICDDSSKYYLNGLFLHSALDDGGTKRLVGVSTDGHKLAIVQLDSFAGEKEFKGFIIPKKSLNELRKIVAQVSNSKDEEENKKVDVFFSETKIKVQSKRFIIISKLIDADFPDYRRVIPKENNNVLNCEKNVLIKAISKVSSVVNESHRGIKLFISKNTLYLEGNSAQNGVANDELTVKFENDVKIEIAFNSKYLLEILGQIESENVNIYLKDNFSAIIVRGEGDENKTFILMPVRI